MSAWPGQEIGGTTYRPQQGVRVTPLPMSPLQQAEEERRRRDQQLQEQAERRAQQDQAMQAERLRLSQGADQRAQSAFEGKGGAPTEYQAKSAGFLGRMIEADQMFNAVPAGSRDARTVPGQWFHETMPGLENTFNSDDRQKSDQAARNFIAASLRQESGAAISAQEYENQYRIFFPMPGDGEEVLQQKAEARRQAIEGFRVSAGPLADRIASQQQAAPAPPPPPVFGPGDPQYQASQGTRTETDPAGAALEGEYRARLQANQSAQEILGWLRSRGASPQTLMQASEQIRYRQANPNVPIDRYSITSTREVPLSGFEKAATGVGSGGAGAYMLGAGNFLSGNTLDNLARDPERARMALDLSREMNPGAFMAGEVSGGVMGALSGEAGLARLGMAPGLVRGALADASMGAANGAGATDRVQERNISDLITDSAGHQRDAGLGERLRGGLFGGLTGLAGSVGGTVAAKGLGRVISPTGGRLAPLYEAGVRPTPGQRFANSNIAGRALNATEEALQSVPVVGAAVQGARQGARDQWQVGAFNEALREVGEQLPRGAKPGVGAHNYAQQAFKRVYDEARSGMRVIADAELETEIGGLFDNVGMLAKPSQQRFRAIAQGVVMRRIENGQLAGGAYKKAISDLGKQIRSIRNSPSGDYELADALQSLQSMLDNAARRHSDPNAVALLDAADAGYAKLVRIEQASQMAGGEMGAFTPAQFRSAVQKTSGGTRSKAFLRGNALMQDYAEQGMNLADRLPNSGTTDRALAAALAGGAAYLEPTTLAALGAVGTAYAPGVRKVTMGAMAPSGPTAKKIAERLRKRARLLGSIGGASAVAALPGTYPGQ